MTYKKICTDREIGDETWETVQLEERDDGWYVETEEIDGEGWRRYATPGAREIDVAQLLRKEYDARY